MNSTARINSRGAIYRVGVALSPVHRGTIAVDVARRLMSGWAYGDLTTIANQYCVAISTVWKIQQDVELALISGNFTQSFMGGTHGSDRTQVPYYMVQFLVSALYECPTLYLKEMVYLINVVFGIKYHKSSIWRALIKQGLSWKKVTRVHTKRLSPENILWRAQYLQIVHMFPQNQIFFLDEASIKWKDLYRSYGWSNQGERTSQVGQFLRGTWVSFIGVIGVQGLLSFKVIAGMWTGQKFFEYVVQFVADELPPISVLVLDNAPVHRGYFGKLVQLVLGLKNCLLLFLPPYSPDLNPMEPAIGLIKHNMSLGYEPPEDLDPFIVISKSAAKITPAHAIGFFRGCGV